MGIIFHRDLLGTWSWWFAAFFGYVGADFVSGIVHWAGDTLGDKNTPIVGRNFIVPFRQHHDDPEDIVRHDFVETNGNNCLVALPPLTWACFTAPEAEVFGLWGCSSVGFLTLFVFLTNQFHKWAHAQNPPRLARLLQRCHLALSPEHHAVHHAPPHDRYYCITVGWLDPLLTRVGFFRKAERLIAAVNPRWICSAP